MMDFHQEMQRSGPDFDGPLHKADLMKHGQQHCDTDMAHDRMLHHGGAWQSIKLLEKYKFVKRNKKQWARSQNDFQRGHMPQDEFYITEEVVKFLKEMLKFFQKVNNQVHVLVFVCVRVDLKPSSTVRHSFRTVIPRIFGPCLYIKQFDSF